MPINQQMVSLPAGTTVPATGIASPAISLDGFQSVTLMSEVIGIAATSTFTVSLQCSPDGNVWATVPAGFWEGSSAPVSQTAAGLGVTLAATPTPEMGLVRVMTSCTASSTVAANVNILAR
jgi:hypothetical protein